jgi:hypothetical protein
MTETLRELLREAIETVHQTGSIRNHSDPNDKTGWHVHGIETCEDALCGLAALARSESPSPGDGLDEDVLYLAQAAEHLTDHLAQEVPTFACEDLDNVQHFAAKIIAAATEQGERT